MSRFRGGIAAILVGGAIAGGIITQTGAGGGGQSCPAFPSFPDASCTGVPAGTTLTTHSGDWTITTDNTTIDSMLVTGNIVVDATGVTIKNTQAKQIYNNGSTRSKDPANPPLTVTDVTIDCDRGTSSAYSTGLWAENVVATRLDISDCENGTDIPLNATLQDSYIHDLYQCSTNNCSEANPPHTDGTQSSDGTNTNYLHNRIEAWTNPCRGTGITWSINDARCNGNAAINIKNNPNPPTSTNVLVEHNLLSGGGYTLQCPQGTSSSNFTINANHWSLVGTDGSGNPNSGSFGISVDCVGETWTSNTVDGSGNALTADQGPPY